MTGSVKQFLRTAWDRENSHRLAYFDTDHGEMELADGEIETWLADPEKYNLSEGDIAVLTQGLYACRAADTRGRFND